MLVYKVNVLNMKEREKERERERRRREDKIHIPSGRVINVV